MPKKSKSEGSVYYNKSRNRFTVQYYENDIKTGKRKRKTKDFKTEEEGQCICSEIQKLATKIDQLNKDIKLCNFIEERTLKMKENIKEMNQEIKVKEKNRNQEIQ